MRPQLLSFWWWSSSWWQISFLVFLEKLILLILYLTLFYKWINLEDFVVSIDINGLILTYLPYIHFYPWIMKSFSGALAINIYFAHCCKTWQILFKMRSRCSISFMPRKNNSVIRWMIKTFFISNMIATILLWKIVCLSVRIWPVQSVWSSGFSSFGSQFTSLIA